MLLTLLLSAHAGSLSGLPSLVGPGEDQPITHLIPAGDLDGDGLGDLVAAVPADDWAAHEAGAVYVVFDAASVGTLTPVADAGVRLSGEQAQGYAGFSVAIPGDTNGDGLPDLAVSAPEADGVEPAAGRVYVVTAIAPGSLGDHPVILGADAWTRAGSRLFAPGDVNGDERADLLIGAPYPTPEGDPDIGWLALLLAPESGDWRDETLLRVDYQGSSGSTLAGVATAWVLPQAGSLVGRSAARVTDQDGDGRDELLVGAPGSGGHQHIAPPDAGSGGSTAHSIGSALLFNLPTPAELNRPVIRTDSEAINTIAGSRLEALPWEILQLADGRVVLSATEGNAVYVFDELTGRALSSDAEVSLTGDDGAMLGWAIADVTGLTGSITLALSEPGWDGGRGRVLLLDPALDGVAAQLAVAVLEGCLPEGEAGYGLDASAGPDPSGAMRPILGITAPEASIFEPGDGVAYLLGVDQISAFDADCPPIDSPPDDADGDGFAAAEDCDDAVPWRYPGAPETCGDGADDDCDGAADEDCGPPPEGGCASAPGAGGLLALLAFAVLTRRRAALLFLPGAAAAADFPVDGAPIATVLGSAEWERLHGPAFSARIDGVATLVFANYQGTNGEHSTGEVALLRADAALGTVDLEGVTPAFTGHEEHDYFGVDAAALPGALIVGADNSGLTERDPGNVAIFLNPTTYAGVTDMEEAEVYLQGDGNADAFGRQVELGDLDGDGAEDLAAAAPMRDAGEALSRGSVWILHGPIDAGLGQGRIDNLADELPGSGPDAWFGWRLEIPGDLTGDGVVDLVVGELGAGPTFGGRLWLYPGGTGGLAEPVGAWEAPSAGDRVGTGLDGGDLDGDGVAELLVGSPLYGRGAGRVWLLSGPPNGVDNLDAEAIAVRDGLPGENLGASVAVGPALLAGAPRSARVYALDFALADLATLTGDSALGSYVGWIDDLNEDAHMDIIAIAPEGARTRIGQGLAFVVSGDALLSGALPTTGVADADADGVPASLDCDDADPRRSPEAFEVCRDGLDNDCDWVADEKDCKRGGCSTGGGGGSWALGLLALLLRRRSLACFALALAGCKAPPLELGVPANPLAGEVPLSLTGNYDQLILEIDGVVLVGAAGPVLSTTWDTTTVSDGDHTVTGKGLLGRDEPVEVFATVTVDQRAGDTEAPVVSFVSPVDGATLPSGVLSDGATIELNVTDNAEIASVDLYADGALLGGLPAAGPYELLWTPDSAGEHTLNAEVSDAAGNTASASVTLTVEDGSGMECTLTSPRDGSSVSGTVELRAAISSPDGVSGADFYADNQLIGSDAASPWSVNWDSSALEGEVTLLLRATDRAGATCEDEVTVTVSSGSGDPFEVVISSPQDGGSVFGANVPVRVAAGGGGGPQAVELYVGGGLIGSDATSPFEFTFDSTTFDNGDLEIRAVGEERGTGATAEAAITVTVNN